MGREEKEKKRKEMQRGGWLFIGCARFRRLPSKGSLSFALPIRPAPEKRQKGNARRIHGRSLLFLVIIRPMLGHGKVVTGAAPCSLSRLAPLLPLRSSESCPPSSCFSLCSRRNVESSKSERKLNEQINGAV